MYQGHPAETRRFAARPFLTFGALWAKSPGQDPICVFDTRPFFSLGRRRPKPVPFHFIPFHSAGLRPGKTEPPLATLARVWFYWVQMETYLRII